MVQSNQPEPQDRYGHEPYDRKARKLAAKLALVHQKRCQILARRLLAGYSARAEVAEDIVSEALLDVVNRSLVPDFRVRASFRTFVSTVVHNKVVDWIRRTGAERRANARASIRQENTEGCTESQSPDDASELHKKALGVLSEVEKAVCHLHYGDQFSHKKISELLKMPENTVKSHLSRARRKMGNILRS